MQFSKQEHNQNQTAFPDGGPLMPSPGHMQRRNFDVQKERNNQGNRQSFTSSNCQSKNENNCKTWKTSHHT